MDIGRLQMKKVEELGPAPSSAPRTLSSVVRDALIERFTKLEAAAFAMNEMDPSQLTRDLKSGKFSMERLDALEPSDRAFVLRRLHDETVGQADPQRYALRLLDEIDQRLREVRQYIAAARIA